jgi:hypothetical protein
MIDLKNRGTNDLEVIIYKLKKRTDVLKKIINKLKDQIKDNK